MYIKNIELKDLATITAGLVREGVCFVATEEAGGWTIELTGGH